MFTSRSVVFHVISHFCFSLFNILQSYAANDANDKNGEEKYPEQDWDDDKGRIC